MNKEVNITKVQQSIIPENLSERDTAFVLMLTREKVVQKLQEKYIDDMEAKNLELKKLYKKLQKKVYIESKYIKTEHAAMFIDVDQSYLSKRQGKVFKLGKHFFKPPGQSIVRWDIEALENWLIAEDNENNIDDELADLLERS
jgi:hypothetical protein